MHRNRNWLIFGFLALALAGTMAVLEWRAQQGRAAGRHAAPVPAATEPAADPSAPETQPSAPEPSESGMAAG